MRKPGENFGGALLCPAGEKIYEARLPLDLRVHELSLLLSKLMEELEPGSYKRDGTCRALRPKKRQYL